MDLLNMTNSSQIHEFYKKVKQRKFLSFKPQFSNLVIYKEDRSRQQMQNFSTISPILCHLGKKNTGTWDENTTIATLISGQLQTLAISFLLNIMSQTLIFKQVFLILVIVTHAIIWKAVCSLVS